MKPNTVTRTIAIATVVVCMLGSYYGCVQKGSDYKSFIASRANTDTVLTMEVMHIAHPGIFSWMGLIFLFLAFITMCGAGMRR